MMRIAAAAPAPAATAMIPSPFKGTFAAINPSAPAPAVAAAAAATAARAASHGRVELLTVWVVFVEFHQGACPRAALLAAVRSIRRRVQTLRHVVSVVSHVPRHLLPLLLLLDELFSLPLLQVLILRTLVLVSVLVVVLVMLMLRTSDPHRGVKQRSRQVIRDFAAAASAAAARSGGSRGDGVRVVWIVDAEAIAAEADGG